MEFGSAGSSPHTRGALRSGGSGKLGARIIPAYAGSTLPGTRHPGRLRDHPRIRGEHRLDIPWPQAMQGSSPHTRGALVAPCRRRGGRGIIPAYAGSTRHLHLRRQASMDHPRIRGEHKVWMKQFRVCGGSSPHTRGAPPTAAPASRSRGIIPAYAGSTAFPEWPATKSEGSSPHTRGARRWRCAGARDRGIIPAYAGSTAE